MVTLSCAQSHLMEAGATTAFLRVQRSHALISAAVADVGVGIWSRLQETGRLRDSTAAAAQLQQRLQAARAPQQGLLRVARLFDLFSVQSAGLALHGGCLLPEWILEEYAPDPGIEAGTIAIMAISPRSRRSLYDALRPPEAAAGPPPLRLKVLSARQGAEPLMARSQARRLLGDIKGPAVVELDFEGVEYVGVPFADEIFRAFLLHHPDVRLVELNAGPEVRRAIRRVRSGRPAARWIAPADHELEAGGTPAPADDSAAAGPAPGPTWFEDDDEVAQPVV